ncbi:macro domain-containing protein [Enterobacter sp. SECR19-1250]|uniref:macro domain-containing protein n=1 Tax=Enterobacter sp. SECR19-1250 TaxID=2749084 RepID=UPI0015B4CC86|nr:macro domain-containing protein [Enterobacter sp. SECR19-1250]NWJ78844.1 macro domain-containing protein [Enterobacter sp. SECR19-1250]
MTTLIHVIQSDITLFTGSAIVNAANRHLRWGGGVCDAIHRAAGNSLEQACRNHVKRHGKVLVGDAVLTPAGNLSCGHVIHTVGPRWFLGLQARKKEAMLARAYLTSMRLAQEYGMSSIAFPCISTGYYGFPPDRAAGIAVRTVLDFCRKSPFPAVWFYCPDKRNADLYHQQLSAVLRQLPHTTPSISTWFLDM